MEPAKEDLALTISYQDPTFAYKVEKEKVYSISGVKVSGLYRRHPGKSLCSALA